MTNTHFSSVSPFFFCREQEETPKQGLSNSMGAGVQLDRTLHCKCAAVPLFRSDGQGVVWVHAHMHED